jgi:hypothetical protein
VLGKGAFDDVVPFVLEEHFRANTQGGSSTAREDLFTHHSQSIPTSSHFCSSIFVSLLICK